MQLTTHFTTEELTRSPTADAIGIDNRPSDKAAENLLLLAVNVLEPLRLAVCEQLFISSGYRCPELNAAVGGAQNSQHMLGQAADVCAVNFTPEQLLLAAFNSGIEFDQAIIEPGWLHISHCRSGNRRQTLLKTKEGFNVYKPRKG